MHSSSRTVSNPSAFGCVRDRLPVELNCAWMDLLDHEDLVRVAAVCRRWRAIATRHPAFYLDVHFYTYLYGSKRFSRRLSEADQHGLPLCLQFALAYGMQAATYNALRDAISLSTEKFMHLVRRLVLKSRDALPPLSFLLSPAPLLTHLVYYVHPGYENFPDERLHENQESSDSEDGDASHEERASAFFLGPTQTLPLGLFSGAAPRLTHVTLIGVRLPDVAIPVLSAVTHVSLNCGYQISLHRLNLALLFPGARSLKIVLTTPDDPGHREIDCDNVGPLLLPAGLESLYLDERNTICYSCFDVLLHQLDTQSVPRLIIQHELDTRWYLMHAHVPSPTRLTFVREQIFDVDGPGTATAVGALSLLPHFPPGRSVTLYDESAWDCGYGNAPRRSTNPKCIPALQPLADRLTTVRMDHRYLHVLFGISAIFPALRRLEIEFNAIEVPASALPRAFEHMLEYGADSCADPDCLIAAGRSEPAADCPALAEVILHRFDDPPGLEGVGALQSHEVLHLGLALGLRQRTAQERPRLVQRGIAIAGNEHEAVFMAEDSCNRTCCIPSDGA